MKPYITIALAMLPVWVFGCASEPTMLEGRYEAPEVDLPLQTADVQRLVDAAPDGGTVTIPLGRYVLSKPLEIHQRRKLHIAFTPGTQLRGENTDDEVIVIEDCQEVTLSGVRARHVKPLPEYNCHGSVITVKDSRGIRIENCELNGCGAIGVYARQSTISIINCHVHHNTFNAFYFSSCEDASVIGNIIENNANTLQADRCGEILWSDNLVRNNGGYWQESRKPGLILSGKAVNR